MAEDRNSPQLSLRERDRRYSGIRQRLREQGIDCAVVRGSNLFYLSNGVKGELFGVLPADDKPLAVIVNRRHLVDISPRVLLDSQDWVIDLKPGFDASAVVEKLKELRLDNGTIGLGGGIDYRFYNRLKTTLSGAKIVDVSDIFTDVRTIKSEEENALIDRANRVFDAAIKRVREVARPGMLGKQVVQEGIRAMWEAGGDLESTLSFNFGPVPAQNPILADLCMTRKIEKGDIGTLTAHAHYRGYAGHSDQEISFGEPKPMHREMFQAVIAIREAVLKQVKDGATQRDLIDAYQKACGESGFKSSPHSQIHQYGIDVPEFPGPAYRIADTKPEAGGLGGAGNFVLKSGMIYSISPTVVGKEGKDTLLGGTSLIVTESGRRDHGDRKVEMLVAS
ncbi:MAG: aminopeptidase P family protein [Deltaproteobacteria bacterium]|nr:aminopeptidase P family protein [Deltaproteobacteria bacterium]